MSLIDKLEELSKDNTSGSSQLLDKLQHIIKAHPEDLKNQKSLEKLKELEDNWPLFPIISHFITHFIKAASAEEDLIKTIMAYNKVWSNIVEVITQRLYQQQELNNKKILLHSQSGTIIKTLIYLNEHHKINLEIFQTESRPALEGRKQAEALSKYFTVTLFPEADIPRVLKSCDYIISGADVITDNHFINKTGTYLLWLSCQHFNKPLFIVADSRKKVNKETDYYKTKIEKIFPPGEIWKDSPSSINIKNRYFELIPLNGVSLYTA